MGTEGRTITESCLKMQFDPYIFTLSCLNKKFDSCDEISKGLDKRSPESKVIWAGLLEPGSPAVVIESGFFYEAFHLDKFGLYHHSSLCTPEAIRQIEAFDAPTSAKDVLEHVKNKTGYVSKYSQGMDKKYKDEGWTWDGVVLASQNPTDRSIRSIASPARYYEFIEGACQHYGSDLFIKLHPWNTGEPRTKIERIADKYGVVCAKTDHKIISKCQFVLVFNSTFAIDCMIRDIPVAQFAPGYFWQMPSVAYTKWEYPDEIKTDVAFGNKLCDFLAWKYCFDYTMPREKWLDMLRCCLVSNELFPMPEEFSYAGYKLRA